MPSKLQKGRPQMTFSRKRGAAALTVLLLAGVTVSSQNKVPGPDLAGIAETKAMHAELIRAIQANTRAQIVIARLASQDARVAAATAQAADAQRELAEVRRAVMAADAEIRRLNLSLSGQPPAQRAEISKEIVEKRAEAADLRKQEQGMRAELTKLQRALAAEQTRRNELSAQLDELERSLPSR
jgi:chromosome segregation ATPase